MDWGGLPPRCIRCTPSSKCLEVRYDPFLFALFSVKQDFTKVCHLRMKESKREFPLEKETFYSEAGKCEEVFM